MHTCLQHERILKNVYKAVQETHDFLSAQASSNGRCKDFSASSKSVDEIMEHVDFVVNYLGLNETDIMHQVIDIPMGTNGAPEIATLTLYADEAAYMNFLVSAKQLNLAKSYSDTYRFIDDGLTWDVDFPSSEIYGLNWSETTLPDGSVNFLGGKISVENDRISISIFNKATEWNFPVIRFPHCDFNVPYYQPAGVFQGQLCRFRIVCNSIKAFKIATTELTRRMLLRRHHPAALIKGWNAHLNRFSKDKITNYSRLRQWFRRMLHWAICNPIMFQYRKREKQWVPKTHLHKKLAQTNSSKLSEGKLMDTSLALENLEATKSRPSQSHLPNLTGVGQVKTSFSFEHQQETVITFPSIIENFCFNNKLPTFLEPHLLVLLNLGKKRCNYVFEHGLSCDEKCLRCLQCFMRPLSLAKHQGSKECDKAKLILEYIQFIQKCKERKNSSAKNSRNSNAALVSDVEQEQETDEDSPLDISSDEPNSPPSVPSPVRHLIHDFQSFFPFTELFTF